MNAKLDGWTRVTIVATVAWAIGFVIVAAVEFSNRNPYCAFSDGDGCAHALWAWRYATESSFKFGPKVSSWLLGLVLPIAVLWFALLGAKWVRAGFHRGQK
jgi:hypothetical protein